MARRRAEGAAVAALKAKAGRQKGHVRAVIYMKPEMLAGLLTEARRRADAGGKIRADVSAVVVEALKAKGY